MGRFYGPIGFSIQVETVPGVWAEQITERNYSGDEIKAASKLRNGENLNDNPTVDNRLSIVADAFALEKFQSIRYVKWMGGLWKLSSVELQRPRLLLTIGEVYNGPTPSPP